MITQAFAIARRMLIESWRQRRSLIFWAVFPALMLALFGLIYRNNNVMRGSFDTTPAGILIGAALFFSYLGGTVSIIVAERERRTLRRLLISPLRPAAYFFGMVLALSVVACAQAAIVFGLAYALGARYHGSVPLGGLIVALSVFAYVGMGFFFGARFAKRAEDVNGPVAAFGVPLRHVLPGPIDAVVPGPARLVRSGVPHERGHEGSRRARRLLERRVRRPGLPGRLRSRRAGPGGHRVPPYAVMVVDMPTARVSALYARTGEAVPLAALAFLALVLFMGARGLPSSRGAA